ncbi:hypothetical protein LINPERPRIM_LOCUS31416, partial [Linum perenne]
DNDSDVEGDDDDPMCPTIRIKDEDKITVRSKFHNAVIINTLGKNFPFIFMSKKTLNCGLEKGGWRYTIFGALIDDAEMEIIDCEKSTNSAPTDKVPECSECGEEKENKDHGSAVANHKKDYSSKTAGSEARPHGVVPTPLGLGGSNKSISNGEPIPVKGGGPVSFPSQPHVSKTSLSKNVTANKSKERAGSGAGVPSASDQLRRKSIKGGGKSPPDGGKVKGGTSRPDLEQLPVSLMEVDPQPVSQSEDA